MRIRIVVSVAAAAVLLALMPIELMAKGKPKGQKPSPPPSATQPTPPAQTTVPPSEEPQEQALFEPAGPSVSDSDPATKNVVPSADAQQAAMKLVKEVYGDEYAKAKTLDQKKELARMLLQKAMETQKDLPSRYVLLKLSRDIATQAGDGTTAFQAIAKMAGTFQVDAAEMRMSALTKFASAAQNSAQHKSIAEQALKLLDEAVSQDNFTITDGVGKLALAEAQKARKKELIAQAQGRISEVAELAKANEDVKAARLTMEKIPDDPQANLVAGKYLCLAKGDWEKGRPLLALGKDEKLKALAKQELDGVASSSQQAKLGDDWWNLAETQEGTAKRQALARADYWYRRALPSLSGLEKDKVEKRIAKPVERKETRTVVANNLVLWNAHNGKWKDRSTVRCNVLLKRQGQVVWQKNDISMPWNDNTDPPTAVRLPPNIRFDVLRVELTEGKNGAAGLSEIEVYFYAGKFQSNEFL